MSTKLTVQQVQEDLCFANEIAEFFGYRANADGTLTAEQYGNDGEVVACYDIAILITKVSA